MCRGTGIMNEVSSNYFLYSCDNICVTNENHKKKKVTGRGADEGEGVGMNQFFRNKHFCIKLEVSAF